jgi:mono/diheme cytochrome c family protein
LLTALAIAACAFFPTAQFPDPFGGGSDASNGERIYFSATSERGTRIRSRGGSAFGGMMTGRQTCASCHGSDGRGGVHWMHMQRMDAPDIRWSTLASEAHGGHDGGDEHSESETAYDEAAFARAVTEGVTPGGATLSRDMPRWQIGEADLQDLVAFMKSLD